MTVYERIKEVRTAVGLSQAKFARRIAVSSSYVAEMELNKKPISERIIKLISIEFNVNIDWLRTGESSMFNTDVDFQITSAISLLRTLDKRFRDCALKQLEDLVDLFRQSED